MKRKLCIILLIVSLVIGFAGGVLATSYLLNQTVKGKVIVDGGGDDELVSYLYEDSQCTKVVSSTEVYLFESGVKRPFWFRSTEISPSSVRVVFFPQGIQGGSACWTPVNGICQIDVWVTSTATSSTDFEFTFTVTGHS